LVLAVVVGVTAAAVTPLTKAVSIPLPVVVVAQAGMQALADRVVTMETVLPAMQVPMHLLPVVAAAAADKETVTYMVLAVAVALEFLGALR
jgi:hypothetical protein